MQSVVINIGDLTVIVLGVVSITSHIVSAIGIIVANVPQGLLEQ